MVFIGFLLTKRMKLLPRFVLLFVVFTKVPFSYGQEYNYKYSEIKHEHASEFDLGYQGYCNLDLTANFELNAVCCSFYGDYQNALDQATKRKTAHNPSESVKYDAGDQSQLIERLKTVFQDSTADENQRMFTQKLLDMATAPDAKELFARAKSVSAIHYIVDSAEEYHFTLINEAHYNSQHRAFTQALLRPLWEVGYRYLALEALSHEDKNLNKRGYPLISTGYYLKDSNFGNLVREALALGYRLVPYETQNDHGGTLRDQDQASNIYEQTREKDKRGKVLIHAGYDHIYEMGGTTYEPMGYQLKNLAKQDILTIDQEEMIGFTDPTKQHSYYREATKQFEFDQPTVFLDNHDEVIADPVSSMGIDIQVYHPETRFEHGRPTWMKKAGTKQIPLATELLKYEGNLIQAMRTGEKTDAVPVDQFVISGERTFLLASGSYDLRIVSCEGDLVGTLGLEVN